MDEVARVRRFNRTVTERVGALDDRYLARDRPLGESRVLWEVGEGGADVRALRTRLGLDSGYLSRLLRSLGDAGLVSVEAAAGDRRVRTVRLTTAGRAERELLDRRSDELAADMLAPLGDDARARLGAAMGEVEGLLTAAQVEIAAVEPPGADRPPPPAPPPPAPASTRTPPSSTAASTAASTRAPGARSTTRRCARRAGCCS